jgi:hypothetical protein
VCRIVFGNLHIVACTCLPNRQLLPQPRLHGPSCEPKFELRLRLLLEPSSRTISLASSISGARTTEKFGGKRFRLWPASQLTSSCSCFSTLRRAIVKWIQPQIATSIYHSYETSISNPFLYSMKIVNLSWRLWWCKNVSQLEEAKEGRGKQDVSHDMKAYPFWDQHGVTRRSTIDATIRYEACRRLELTYDDMIWRVEAFAF